jgi:hypothetical protein
MRLAAQDWGKKNVFNTRFRPDATLWTVWFEEGLTPWRINDFDILPITAIAPSCEPSRG